MVEVVQVQVPQVCVQLFAKTVQVLPLESVPAFVASVVDAVQVQETGGSPQVCVRVSVPEPEQVPPFTSVTVLLRVLLLVS